MPGTPASKMYRLNVPLQRAFNVPGPAPSRLVSSILIPTMFCFFRARSLVKTLFVFEADATALVPEVLKLGFEDEYEELEADLQDFSEKFADSPAAQVR